MDRLQTINDTVVRTPTFRGKELIDLGNLRNPLIFRGSNTCFRVTAVDEIEIVAHIDGTTKAYKWITNEDELGVKLDKLAAIDDSVESVLHVIPNSTGAMLAVGPGGSAGLDALHALLPNAVTMNFEQAMMEIIATIDTSKVAYDEKSHLTMLMHMLSSMRV